MTSVAPIATRLPRLTPGQAAGATRLLALLACAGLRARALPEPGCPGGMHGLRFTLGSRHGELGFEPLHAGAPVGAPDGPDSTLDLIAATETLEAAEPAIAALERALGTPLLPGPLAAPAPGARVQVEVELPQGLGARLDAAADVLLRLPEPDWRDVPSAVLGYALRCRVILGGCGLTREAAARLQAGDVLVDPLRFRGAPVVRLVAPDGREAAATLHPAAGALHFSPTRDSAMPSPSDSSEPTDDDWARLPVQLRFELPRASVPLGTLAGLQPGAVIPIATPGERLEVVVSNGGRAIGRGELVALGDGFGVRLTGPLAGSS